MKYYLITFGDYSETIGKQTSKAAMMKDARQYCRMWDIECGIKEITEITEAEYNNRKH